MGLFVDFCLFTWIWLDLPDQNLKLFCFDVQNNLGYNTEINKQLHVKFLIEKNIELSPIDLAVLLMFLSWPFEFDTFVVWNIIGKP